MKERCLRPLICPLCRQPLHSAAGSVRCGQNHSFDVAREGYLNLLPSSGKRPKFLGDSQEMLLARRRFLESGLYAPLRARLLALAQQCVGGMTEPVVVELGCGEGYYVGGIAEAWSQRWADDGCFLGVDLAKEAARLAARRYRSVQFVVADVKRPLPLAPASTHLLLNIFAPRQPAGFAALLAPAGWLLVVIPSKHHLANLRQQLGLLGIETDKEAKVVAQFAPWFRLALREEWAFELLLDGTALADLVLMSPSARHLDSEQQAALTTVPPQTSKASFTLLLFQKTNDEA